MERKEWREKLEKARKQEEFSELFDQIPEATGAEIRTEAREFFTMEQKTIFPHLTSSTPTAKTKAGQGRGVCLTRSNHQEINRLPFILR